MYILYVIYIYTYDGWFIYKIYKKLLLMNKKMIDNFLIGKRLQQTLRNIETIQIINKHMQMC